MQNVPGHDINFWKTKTRKLGYLICILFSDNWLKRIATKGKKYI